MKLLKSFVLLAALVSCQQEEVNTEQCTEKPRGNIMCTTQYDPVCGCNNKTYSNACEAEAVGITNYTKGACK